MLYAKEVQAERYEDEMTLAQDGCLYDFFELECRIVQAHAEELQGRPDEKDAPPRGIV